MLKNASGAGEFAIGLVSAIPAAAGAIAMVIVSRNSDRTGERRLDLMFCVAERHWRRLEHVRQQYCLGGFHALAGNGRLRIDVRAVLGYRHRVDARRRRRRRDRTD